MDYPRVVPAILTRVLFTGGLIKRLPLMARCVTEVLTQSQFWFHALTPINLGEHYLADLADRATLFIDVVPVSHWYMYSLIASIRTGVYTMVLIFSPQLWKQPARPQRASWQPSRHHASASQLRARPYELHPSPSGPRRTRNPDGAPTSSRA